jgi:hypothetical protein
MTVSDDPFESAARHEHTDQLRREAAVAAVRSSLGTVSGSRGMLIAIVVFLGPYVP